jgi:hypothetical protein
MTRSLEFRVQMRFIQARCSRTGLTSSRPDDDTTTSRRDRGGSAVAGAAVQLEDLLALSLRMTNTSDEEAILRLAGTAVPSLAHCRLLGAHLADETWT